MGLQIKKAGIIGKVSEFFSVNISIIRLEISNGQIFSARLFRHDKLHVFVI